MKASRNPVRGSWIDRATPTTLVLSGLALVAVGGALWAPTLIRWRVGGDLTCFVLILGTIAAGFGISLISAWFNRLLGRGMVAQRRYVAPAATYSGVQRNPLFPKVGRATGKGRWLAVRLVPMPEMSWRDFLYQGAGLAVAAIPLALLGGWWLGVGGQASPHFVLWLCLTGVLYFLRRLVLAMVPSWGPLQLNIEVSGEPLQPGQTVHMVVSATRDVELRALRVAAVCRESASHGSGSDRVTKTHEACEIELLATGPSGTNGSRPLAEFTWEVPVDAMHSFAGTNNELAWQFVLGLVDSSGQGRQLRIPFRIGPGTASSLANEP